MDTHRLFQPLDRPLCRLVLGTSFFRHVEQEEAEALFDAYTSLGGNCFDTAVVYWDIEEALGRWMRARGNRSRMVLHAKGAHHETRLIGKGPAELHCSRVNPRMILEDLDISLARLDTDYLDLYVLHRDDPDYPVEPIVDCLAAAQSQDRIRAFGASNWTRSRIESANAYAQAKGIPGFVSSSSQFSLAFPNEPSWPNCTTAREPGTLAWHQGTGFPLFAWSTLALGFFAQGQPLDDLSEEEKLILGKDPWARNMVRVFSSPRNFERLERARELASKKGVSPTQIALAWVLHHSVEAYAIAGPRTVAELQALFDAFQITLNPTEMAWLELSEGRE